MKRLALNMKASPALRARIDAAAEVSGLSIAQEVERRLIESFRAEDTVPLPVSEAHAHAMLVVAQDWLRRSTTDDPVTGY